MKYALIGGGGESGKAAVERMYDYGFYRDIWIKRRIWDSDEAESRELVWNFVI